jgi:hypothetical protein
MNDLKGRDCIRSEGFTVMVEISDRYTIIPKMEILVAMNMSKTLNNPTVEWKDLNWRKLRGNASY